MLMRPSWICSSQQKTTVAATIKRLPESCRQFIVARKRRCLLFRHIGLCAAYDEHMDLSALVL